MFLFTIEEEASLIPLRIRKKNEVRMVVDCPFCEWKKSNMIINFQKNVYHCFRCNTGGGLTTLYANYYGISNREAYREIMSRLNLNIHSGYYHEGRKPKYEIQTEKQLPDARLDRAYSTLLSQLVLKETHEKQLLKRGLTGMELDYYSVPSNNLVLGPEYEHIPGCYQNGKHIITNFPNTTGFIIPIRSFFGHIIGLQIRLDKPYSNTKYMWFSSNYKPGGSSSGAPIHFVGKKDAAYIYIIEGALKGNIANYLDPERIQSAACVAGVNNIKHLEKLLKEADPYKNKKIILCYDMDKFHNHYVMEGEVTLYNMLYRMGYRPAIYNWIDDKEEVANFYHGKSGNLIPIIKNNKMIGFSFVYSFAYRCGFDFYDTTNLTSILKELKKEGLRDVTICSSQCNEEQTEFSLQVIEILKKVKITTRYKDNVYDKNKKGIDDFLKSA